MVARHLPLQNVHTSSETIKLNQITVLQTKSLCIDYRLLCKCYANNIEFHKRREKKIRMCAIMIKIVIAYQTCKKNHIWHHTQSSVYTHWLHYLNTYRNANIIIVANWHLNLSLSLNTHPRKICKYFENAKINDRNKLIHWLRYKSALHFATTTHSQSWIESTCID